MRKISEPFNITTKDGLVFGFYNPDGSVKILKNSYFRNFETNTLLPVYRNKRAELKSTGYVTGERFIRDFTFKNACEAYCCCYGRQDNGIAKFYTIDNVELDNFLSDVKKRFYLEKDDEDLVIATDNVDDDEYDDVPISEKEKREINSYKRNRQIVKQALENSNYQCDIDNKHITFITKNNKPYMEAHHLIPLSTQGLFNTTGLDSVANVVCLCPNCHRNLHYGKDIKPMLEKLFNERKQVLEQTGIMITFDELLELYK